MTFCLNALADINKESQMQYSQASAEERNEAMSQVTMRKGYWFYFKHEGHDISVHGSAWSGQETVYVDNHPVSDIRNLTSLTGEHHFVIDNNQYHLTIKVTSILRGTIEVTLRCNDEIVGVESKSYVAKTNGKKFTKELLILMAAGAVVGYLVGSFIAPFIVD
jgi:hypothetical protein